jgi:hypothetical protein
VRLRIALRLAWLVTVTVGFEAVVRVVFPAPEVEGFNRIAYSPLLQSREGGHAPPLQNASFSWSSALDHAGSLHRLNLYGFRDAQWSLQKRPATRRVAFVGDSYVEGFMAAAPETIPAVFRSLAGAESPTTEALNLGVGGAGLREYCLLIHDAVPLLRPDDVFLVLYANDLPAPTFDAKWLSTSSPITRIPWWSPRTLTVAESAWRGAGVARRWSTPPFEFLPSVPDARNPWTKHVFPFIDSELQAEMRSGRFNPFLMNQLLLQEARLKAPSGVAITIEALSRYILAHGARLWVAYIPYHCVTSDHYVPFHRRLSQPVSAPSLMGEQYRLHERELEQACRQVGVAFISLTPFLRAAEARGQRMYWEYDEHMRPAGYRLVAEELFSWWRSHSRPVGPS